MRKYVLSLCQIILIDKVVKNLLNLFFPKLCFGCRHILSDNEVDICTSCRHELPVTNYHLKLENPVEKVFYGRVKIERATALFRFHKKGLVQQLLHNLKYRGQEGISRSLGKWMGHDLDATGDYDKIDYVIPVPLHKKKLRKRGFNQVSKFGQEIAAYLNATYAEDVLIKTSSTATQVFKKRFARWSANEEVFNLKNTSGLHGKHLLLVDDIITTGATIEACASKLQSIPNIKISVATMAIAD